MGTSSTPERRHAARLRLGGSPPVEARLTCMSSGQILSGHLVNVSLKGCCMALDPGQRSETGMRCALRFELAGPSQSYDLLVTIVRSRQHEQATELGLRFDGLETSRAPRQRLAEAIARLAEARKSVRDESS
jgi:c-di-GMP-binding flagellar brake protein YcgR